MTTENVHNIAPDIDVEAASEAVLKELELHLAAEELGALLLAQERVKTAGLEQQVGKLKWEILVHQRKLNTQEEMVKIQAESTRNQQVIMGIDRRLKIRMRDYAFDDLTGKLSLIETTKEK